MSLCEILIMVLINSGKSIIQGNNLSSFHGLNLIRMIYKKSHAQPENLLSCHGTENIVGFPINRRIPEKICPLTLILQGGIALFAVFATEFTLSWKIVRNGKKPVALPDSEQRLRFPDKSLILRTNLLSFHGMVRDRMISKKSHDLSSELMSSRYIGII